MNELALHEAMMREALALALEALEAAMGRFEALE